MVIIFFGEIKGEIVEIKSWMGQRRDKTFFTNTTIAYFTPTGFPSFSNALNSAINGTYKEHRFQTYDFALEDGRIFPYSKFRQFWSEEL